MGRVGGARRQAALHRLRPRHVLGAGVQLYGDCLDSAHHDGLVAVDAARVVSRSRLVVIEKSRLAAAAV